MRNNKKYSIIISVLLFCVLLNPVYAQVRFFALENDYYPTESPRVLATSTAGEVTEADLFLYLLLSQEDRPYLFKDYITTTDPSERAQMKESIKKYIQEIVYHRLLARREGVGLSGRSKQDLKHLRIILHPIYDYIWTNGILKAKIKVLDEDIRFYYQRHINEFVHPEKVRVRTIFLKSPSERPMPERRKVREKLERLRQQILNGADFEEMAKKYSEAKNAPQGGLLPAFSRGTFFSDFEKTAFALEPHQLSTVQDFKDGFYIIQCLEKIPAEKIGLDDARTTITRRLSRYQLKLRHTAELKKLIQKALPKIDISNFEVRSEDTPIVKVKKFYVTKREMLTFFPQIYKGLFFDTAYLMDRATHISTYEVIAQCCESLGLTKHNKMLELAKSMAMVLMDAEDVEKQYLKPSLTITPEDEKKYYDAHQDEMRRSSLYHIYQMWGELKNPAQYSFSEQTALMRQLQQKVDDFLAETKVKLANKKLDLLSAALKGETQTLEKQRSALPVESIMASLKKLETEQFAFHYKNAGMINLDYLPMIKQYVEGLAPEEFSKPYRQDNLIVWFYVKDVIPGEKLTFEKARSMVFFHLLKERKQKALQTLKHKTLSSANIKFLF
ncbi:peptidyl-prolyl cis-trans isomerase [Candidatus Sumerlaeota bacterium]|nr:peptidyl-prolyl cis-trans isomerase [Candidatus Sumerlaeota bacterium]